MNMKQHSIRGAALSLLFLTAVSGVFCDIHAACPVYTHKDDVLTGKNNTLPEGFCAFRIKGKAGLYTSSIRSFAPRMVPNTSGDDPYGIQISDDGNWIVYVNYTNRSVYLIRTDGTQKTKVPLNGPTTGFPLQTGFNRKSPFGLEIFYPVSTARVRAIKVTLGTGKPVLGTDRLIADLKGKLLLGIDRRGSSMDIIGDQIFTRVDTVRGTQIVRRTGYITIPDAGKGVAGSTSNFRWSNDDYKTMYGCGYTLSHDGSLALANSGLIGSTCVPNKLTNTDHKGFYISPFRRVTDSPMGIHECVDKYGTSINWCPKEYRFGNCDQVDFTDWNFSNDKNFVVGILRGTGTPIYGMWVVHWKTNTWTLLNPGVSTTIEDPAMFFGRAADTGDVQQPIDTSGSSGGVDASNPGYRIVYPNGGERFTTGQTITLRFSATRDGEAGVFLIVNKYSFMITTEGSINPRLVPQLSFTVPDTLDYEYYDPVEQGPVRIRVPIAGTDCAIALRDYSAPDIYNDASDGFFTIEPSLSARASSTIRLQSAAARNRFEISYSLMGRRSAREASVPLLVRRDCRDQMPATDLAMPKGVDAALWMRSRSR